MNGCLTGCMMGYEKDWAGAGGRQAEQSEDIGVGRPIRTASGIQDARRPVESRGVWTIFVMAAKSRLPGQSMRGPRGKPPFRFSSPMELFGEHRSRSPRGGSIARDRGICQFRSRVIMEL